MFFTEGVTWSLHANHVAVKARYQDSCVFDASGSRLTPDAKQMSAAAFLAILNSDVYSFFLKRFVKHNQDVEINDMRMLPIVIPNRKQAKRLKDLAEQAIAAKRLSFAAGTSTNEMARSVRQLTEELDAEAPLYLRPPAQMRLLTTPELCLAILERAVNWEVEKLYGVEGLGPFDEF